MAQGVFLSLSAPLTLLQVPLIASPVHPWDQSPHPRLCSEGTNLGAELLTKENSRTLSRKIHLLQVPKAKESPTVNRQQVREGDREHRVGREGFSKQTQRG